jgi:hypothetical protein
VTDPESAEPVYWLAYDADWSGLAVFDSEIEALRYAVSHSMLVAQVELGRDLREQVR